MYHPTRGGTRGGQAEFSWQDVRNDKDRENYLGHSVNAPTGRWQKGKDVNWYNKDKEDADDLEKRREELREVKRREEEEIRRKLGGAPLPPSLSSSAIEGPRLGANLLSGSSSRSHINPSTSTGSNRAHLDPARTRSWGQKGGAAGSDGSSTSMSPSARNGPGKVPELTEEERRIAKKLARMEGKRLRHEERERIRQERRKRRGDAKDDGDDDRDRSRERDRPDRRRDRSSSRVRDGDARGYRRRGREASRSPSRYSRSQYKRERSPGGRDEGDWRGQPEQDSEGRGIRLHEDENRYRASNHDANRRQHR